MAFVLTAVELILAGFAGAHLVQIAGKVAQALASVVDWPRAGIWLNAAGWWARWTIALAALLASIHGTASRTCRPTAAAGITGILWAAWWVAAGLAGARRRTNWIA